MVSFGIGLLEIDFGNIVVGAKYFSAFNFDIKLVVSLLVLVSAVAILLRR